MVCQRGGADEDQLSALGDVKPSTVTAMSSAEEEIETMITTTTVLDQDVTEQDSAATTAPAQVTRRKWAVVIGDTAAKIIGVACLFALIIGILTAKKGFKPNPIQVDCGLLIISLGAYLISRKLFNRNIPGLLELCCFSIIFGCYDLSRAFSLSAREVAIANAEKVINLEGILGLNFEANIQALLRPFPLIVKAFNYFYLLAHWSSIVIFFVWLYVRERRQKFLEQQQRQQAPGQNPEQPPRMTFLSYLIEPVNQNTITTTTTTSSSNNNISADTVAINETMVELEEQTNSITTDDATHHRHRHRHLHHDEATAMLLTTQKKKGKRYYHFYRNAFVMTNLIAISFFFLFPCAPPRLMTQYGFVDTVQVYSNITIYDTEAQWVNPYAAMPSLHFGYSFLFGIGAAQVTSSLIPYMYPFMMLVSIVGTGNHYILDAVGGGFVVLAAIVVTSAAYAVFRRIARFVSDKKKLTEISSSICDKVTAIRVHFSITSPSRRYSRVHDEEIRAL